MPNEVEMRMQRMEHLRNVETVQARLNAAEARAGLLARKATQNERLQGEADKALSDVDSVRSELEELTGNPLMALPDRDPEGTRAGLSDIHGNYATNQKVANAGGTGVLGSNSTEDGAIAEDPEDAGVETEGGVAVTGRGGRAENPAGETLTAPESEEEGTSRRPRGRKPRKSDRAVENDAEQE